MLENELKPDVGKKTFAQHLPELEQALRQMANALGADGRTDISGFFWEFISGCWDPFEEVCEEIAQRQEGTTGEIRALGRTLRELTASEHRPLLEKYSGLLIDRNNTALDYAFLMGYQCAIRFILMGIIPASKFLKEQEVSS